MDQTVRQLRQQLQGVDMERAEALEALDKYISACPNKEADSVISAVQFFEGGRYTDTIRMIYYTLLKNELAPGRCRAVMGSILQSMKIDYDRLPSLLG